MSSIEQARGLFERAAATFRSVLLDVRPHQLHLPTPCRPLDVAQLVSTAIGHQNWTRAAIAGTSAPRAYPDIAADRWVTEFDESTATMLATIDDDEAMGRTVGLAAGLTFPAPDVAVLAARNIFQFGWDLAGPIGHDLDLSPDLARELLDISRSRLVPQRGPNGFFGPEQIPPAGSPLATVLAGYLGRDV